MKSAPNLEDYATTYRSFSWNSVRRELDWFNHHINAAYNAIDRHTSTWRKNKVALYWHGEDDSRKKFTFEELSIASNKFGNIKEFNFSF